MTGHLFDAVIESSAQLIKNRSIDASKYKCWKMLETLGSCFKQFHLVRNGARILWGQKHEDEKYPGYTECSLIPDPKDSSKRPTNSRGMGTSGLD